MDAQQSVSFQSSSSEWKDSQIIVGAAAVLNFEVNQFQTQGTLTKTGGDLSWDNVSWNLLGDTSYTSNSPAEINTLALNNKQLTLGSSDSDLTVSDNVTLDASSEKILTGAADLILQGGFVMQDGLVSSTTGLVSLDKGGEQSGGSGTLDVSGSTLKLGDDFSKTAGTLTTTIDGTTLELAENLTLTSDTSLDVKP